MSMTLKILNGYWTIYSGEQPVMSYASFDAAHAMLRDLELALPALPASPKAQAPIVARAERRRFPRVNRSSV